MKTVFLLMAEFETPHIKLAEVCEKYFGLSYPPACRLASVQQLPVPVFRGGSQKSGWLIDVNDLAQYIDSQREKARRDWQKMNGHP